MRPDGIIAHPYSSTCSDYPTQSHGTSLPYATSDPEECSKSLLSTRQRPGQLESWSFGTSDYHIGDQTHKWSPYPAVCACMQCSTWAREAQAPRLRACTIRHRRAHTKRLIVMDLVGMQTRGSDRSIFLLHVLIGSYEVTSLVERGSSSSTKTHRSKPVSRQTNTGR